MEIVEVVMGYPRLSLFMIEAGVEIESARKSTTYPPTPLQPSTPAPMPQAPFTITLEPDQLQFPADSAQTVLQSALKADVLIPSSCRNGTCRSCVCTLLSGQISYNIAWPGLSLEEKQAGLILPCVAHAQSDLVMRLGY
jgi:ferredoxin